MSSIITSIVTKTTGLANCAVYWAKVGAELSKAVYKAEGLNHHQAKNLN